MTTTAPAPVFEWNEATDGYMPPAVPQTTVALHTETADEIPPISYEVIRHALWNVNIEHGHTILKVSGSPVALYAHDFNPCITTEDGEMVYFGQYVQHLCGGAPAAVKWTLEHRDISPGIKEGDIFLACDPWISCNHQPDLVLLKPVFWEGVLFSWITSTLHMYDLGGTTPGSFCPDAQNIYYETTPIPPIKLVEGDEIRLDVEEMVLRKSRLPDLVRLDLRAMIAGCNVATSRLTNLCEKYSAPIVKKAMRKIADDSEQVFLSRLRTIPDGTWRERNFLESALPGDEGVYELDLSVTKEGDTVTWRNEGTDPQVGALNTSIVGFRGGIMTAMIGPFLHDQLFAYAGMMRHIKFEPTPGTITCAQYPAAVSCAPNTSMLVIMGQANALVAKMMSTSTSKRNRREGTAKFAASQYPILSISGVNQWGAPYATVLLDAMLAGIGAFQHRDGVSTGGYPFDPKAIAPNVEFNEQSFPMLYLYRKELADSAGPGRFRGGASASWAWIPHGSDNMALATAGGGVWVPTGNGMYGGGVGAPARYALQHDTDALEQMAGGNMPTALEQLSGELEELPPKATGIVQGPTDAAEMQYPGAGGYGDPFTRDPALVAADVEEELVSVDGAERFYGVAVNEAADGTFSVDADGTQRLRDAERERRRSESSDPSNEWPEVGETSGSGVVELGDGVTIDFDNGSTVFSCQACSAELGRDLPSYKAGARVAERELVDAVPVFRPGPSAEAKEVVLREHYCPSCFVRLDAELARRGDASLVDMEIWAPPSGGAPE